MMQRWPGGREEHTPKSIYPGGRGAGSRGTNTLIGTGDVRCILTRPEARIKILIEREIHENLPPS